MTSILEQRERRSRNDGVLSIIRSVRRRWRLRVALRGLAITLGAGFVAFLVSAYGLDALRFSPGAVAAFRVAVWGVVGVLGIFFLVRPLVRRVTDRQVALYLEEHEPTLEASILGAVEAEEAARSGKEATARTASPALLRRLIERAVERAREVENGRRIEQKGLYTYSGALAAVAIAGVLFLLLAPSGLRTGMGALLVPTSDAATVSPYSIELEPGDATVARGSDQFVRARLVGFESEEVSLFTRTPGLQSPRRISMIPTGEAAAGDATHEVLLLDLQEATEYFVEADGVRSATFTLDVAELPYVQRMDHRYRYPAYTGLPERMVEDGGDIVALAGTTVDVTVEPTISTPGGRILVEDGEPIELERGEDGTLTASLPVSERGYYQIELARANGDMVEASPRYVIDVLRDLPPSISVTEPGRDTEVSPIEEVYLEARADDDYGVDEVRLVYAVNGGAQDTVNIFRASGAPLGEVTAGHTLFLEEYGLEPGDMVSYFVEAKDSRTGRTGEWVTSDLYFLQIRPFRRDFRQAEQQPGGGGQPGGAGQNQESGLGEIQRQVVVATFNLIRDQESFTEEELTENLTSVALSQGRVREQVATLAQRMESRGLSSADERFGQIAELLPQAVEDMTTAEDSLRAGEPGGAIRPEQRALRTLQKAEETYERVVGQQQQGGGGGGGGSNAEDLADLFELELDKLQNQYETVQRGQRQQQSAEVDELMEKLKELASRQEQELERQRQRAAAQQQRNAGGGGGSQSQRSLAEETEEAARQLERLARETGDQQLQETARQLRDAAEAMRRSAANSGQTSGTAEAGSALDQIQEAERRLRRERQQRLENQAQDALERADRLAEQQEQVRERLEDLSEDPESRTEQIRRLDERKQQMMDEVNSLARDLDEAARQARLDDPGTARQLSEAADSIRESNLEAKLAWSRGVMRERDPEFVRQFEEGIQEDIESVRRQLERSARSARELGDDRSAEEALERARDLVRSSETLDRRLDPQAQGQQQGEQQGQQSGQPSGQQQGQQGQQGGQQGQPGDSTAAGQPGQEGGQQGQQQGGQAGQQGQEGRQGGGAGNPTGRVGQPTGDDYRPGGGATRGSPRAFTPEEIRQFRRSFQEQLEAARELRRQLAEDGMETAELDRAIEAMRSLSQEDVYGDLPQVALLQQTLRESLKRVEFTLRREVEGVDRGRAALSGSDEVPEGFRALVEEYYKALARGGGGTP